MQIASPTTAAQLRVRATLQRLVATGAERGAQVAAYRNGELVVHAWAGQAADGVPVGPDTLFPAFSVSKGLVATLLHVLVDRGALAYDTRIAAVWPEFAAHGKDAATVDHLLEHSAGVPYLPTGLRSDDLLDQVAIAARIAAAEPVWTPGELTGYHSLTFGYVAAELVQRVTGSTLYEAVHELLAVPLGIADELFISPPDALADRLAEIESDDFAAAMAGVPPQAPFMLAVGNLDVTEIIPSRTVPPGRHWQADAPLPFGVTMTARAGAVVYAMLAGGGRFDGTRILSAGRVEQATTIRRRDVDQVLGAPVLKSRGYSHADEVTGEDPAAFGFGGLGGSEAYADPRRGLSFAFTHNRLTPPGAGDSAVEIAAEVRAAQDADAPRIRRPR